MPEPTLIQSKTTLPVAEIRADRRLRPVSEAGVEAILASVGELGQIVTPLTVRQRQVQGSGLVYELLDGAHRLEAARRLGHGEVPVRVFECTGDQAALMEIDGNLAGAELNALDTAVFLATRKAVYERLHPETRQGGSRGNQHTGGWQTDMMSFCQTTAEKFGLSERHVRRMTAAGARLGPDEVQQLRLAPRPVTLADLQAISAIGEAVERYEVVRQLATGEAKSAAAARKAWFHRENPPAPVSPEDAEFAALHDRWARTSKAARRRFVAANFDELAVLVAEESVRHGDKAFFLNRALPFDGGAGE
ncbi:ParB/RepB/Spo0J family partition protein [Paracoccus sanguinis]|uniref:ParB/RepB/Spo0J family partition protein n=1 Tax=Paracoccus sanguinis TaxID=1545044 RepID=UPI0009DE6DA0|nr:ParB N-terminal domain-containing protein [Paracoccus sanguinis]